MQYAAICNGTHFAENTTLLLKNESPARVRPLDSNRLLLLAAACNAALVACQPSINSRTS